MKLSIWFGEMVIVCFFTLVIYWWIMTLAKFTFSGWTFKKAAENLLFPFQAPLMIFSARGRVTIITKIGEMINE